MNDKKLIAKLQELKQIKPSQDWVVSLKKEIIGEQPKFGSPAYAKASVGRQILTIFEVLPKILFQRKLAYVFAFCLVVLIGAFGFAQNTVPGDLLFPVKKITEISQTALLSGAEQSKYNLEIANKRLDDLTAIVKSNRVKNIAPAVKEYKDSENEVAKNLMATKDNPKAMKEIAVQVKKLEENKKNLEITLGSMMDEEGTQSELNNVLASLVGGEIESLKKTTLSEAQQQTLAEIKGLYDEGQFADALIKVLTIKEVK